MNWVPQNSHVYCRSWPWNRTKWVSTAPLYRNFSSQRGHFSSGSRICHRACFFSKFCEVKTDHGFMAYCKIANKGKAERSITLLMAQWADMEALKNHASLWCFFDFLGAVRQINSLETASSRVVTHRHALSAWFFQLPCLPIEPLGGLDWFWFTFSIDSGSNQKLTKK